MERKKFTIWMSVLVLTFILIPICTRAEECDGCISGWDIKGNNSDVPSYSNVYQNNGSYQYDWNGQSGATFKVGNNFQLDLSTGDYGMPSPIIETNGGMKQNPEYSQWFDSQKENFKEAIAKGDELSGFLAVIADALKANGFDNPEDYINTLESEGSALQYDLYPGAVINGQLMTELDAGSPEYEACMKENFGCAAVKVAQSSCGQGYITQNTCSFDDTGFKDCKTKTCEEQHPDNPEVCDPNKPLEDLINPTCGEQEIPKVTISCQPQPQPIESDGLCGENYIKVNYSITHPSSCSEIDMLVTTTTTAQLPGMGGTVLAGKGFNFEDEVVVSTSTTVQFFDDCKLRQKMADLQRTISLIEVKIDCAKKKIEEYEKIIRETQDAWDKCSEIIGCLKINEKNPNKCDTPVYGCPTDKSQGYQNRINEARGAIVLQQQELIKLMNNPDYADAVEQLKDLSTRCNSGSITSISNSSSTSTIATVSANMVIENGNPQGINTIKGIAKGSGNLLTQDQINKLEGQSYVSVDDSFIVPVNVRNGATGVVNASVSGIKFSCPFNVANYIPCKDDECQDSNPPSGGGLALIYRPISLTNPFPNEKNTSTYREMGLNWNENLADIIIKNNRGVNDYEIYNKEPIYTITLTPSNIREIRDYNKRVSYNNFDMNCTNGYLCSSNFLWKDFRNIISEGESCATENGWENCYGGGN